jgi:hypothetical protein
MAADLGEIEPGSFSATLKILPHTSPLNMTDYLRYYILLTMETTQILASERCGRPLSICK